MSCIHSRFAILGAAVVFGSAALSSAADQLLFEAQSLARDGSELTVVLPSGQIALSSKVVGVCLPGSRDPDDILIFDLATGLCEFIPAAERFSSPMLVRPAVELGDSGGQSTIQDCLGTHRGVLIRETSGIALCFDWYTCEDLAPIILGEDSVCAGSSIFLDAGEGFASYLWEPGGETTQEIEVSPSTDTLYGVTVSDDWLCTGVDVHLVTVAPLPEPAITGPTAVCLGEPVTLDAGPGFASYLWEPGGATTQTIEVAPLTSTGFTVTVSDTNGCTGASGEHFVDVSVCGNGIFADDFETGNASRWSMVVP